MGRPHKNIDEVALLQMRGEKKTMKEIAKALNVSVPTITRRIAVLQHDKGIPTKYRQLQGLQLTELQARILENVDKRDFGNDSLIELIQAFLVLKKAEISIQGKESIKVWGLLDHLQALESLE